MSRNFAFHIHTCSLRVVTSIPCGNQAYISARTLLAGIADLRLIVEAQSHALNY
jgi:hypothetical protein